MYPFLLSVRLLIIDLIGDLFDLDPAFSKGMSQIDDLKDCNGAIQYNF
jgi:hypothetical protein